MTTSKPPLLNVLKVFPQPGRPKWDGLTVHPGDEIDMDAIHGDGSHRYYIVGGHCDYCEKTFQDGADVVIEVRKAQVDSRVMHSECHWRCWTFLDAAND